MCFPPRGSKICCERSILTFEEILFFFCFKNAEISNIDLCDDNNYIYYRHSSKTKNHQVSVLVLPRTGLIFCSSWPGSGDCSTPPHILARSGQKGFSLRRNSFHSCKCEWSSLILFIVGSFFFLYFLLLILLLLLLIFLSHCYFHKIALISTWDLFLLSHHLEGGRKVIHDFSWSIKLGNNIFKSQWVYRIHMIPVRGCSSKRARGKMALFYLI